MNWLCVHTEAIVVISLMVTVAGGLLPTTVIKAIAALLPAALLPTVPPLATRYRLVSLPVSAALNEKLPSLPVCPWASCLGVPVLADQSVTVEPEIGAPAPVTRPLIVVAPQAGSGLAIATAKNRVKVLTQSLLKV